MSANMPLDGRFRMNSSFVKELTFLADYSFQQQSASESASDLSTICGSYADCYSGCVVCCGCWFACAFFALLFFKSDNIAFMRLKRSYVPLVFSSKGVMEFNLSLLNSFCLPDALLTVALAVELFCVNC